MDRDYSIEFPNIIGGENGDKIKNLIDYDFNDNRTVWLSGTLDDPMDGVKISIAINYLSSISKDDITLKISHYGGNIDTMWIIINAMNRSRCDFRTEIHGEALSAAAKIFINGTPGKRYMTPNSFLMFHECLWSTSYDSHSKNMNIIKNYHEVNFNNVVNFISDKSGRSIKEVKQWLKEDKWFTPEDAINLGLCDKILK